MFRCREVFPEFTTADGTQVNRANVLSVDFSVDCDSTLHAVHEFVASVFIAIAVALPAVVIWRVRGLSRDDGEGAESDNCMISHRVATELGVSMEGTQEAITGLCTARSFSFMTAGLASQFLWWESVDMLRKLSIVGAGTLIGTGNSNLQLFMVQLLACVWLIVQVRVRPYRLAEVRCSVRAQRSRTRSRRRHLVHLRVTVTTPTRAFATAMRQDNALKTVCDLATIVTCACQLAHGWAVGGLVYEVAFMVAMVVVLISCTLAVIVKVCRLMVHTAPLLCWPYAVLKLVDGTRGLASPGRVDTAPAHMQEEQLALSKYCAMGVVSAREEALLLSYFERVRVSEGKRQQMFEEKGGVPWIFVSTPEHIPDGDGGNEQVMEYIQGICRERPWQFKQAFDWASSGNSYPADNAAWDEIGPAKKAWFKATKKGDKDGASDIIKHKIAPLFLGMDWCSAWAVTCVALRAAHEFNVCYTLTQYVVDTASNP